MSNPASENTDVQIRHIYDRWQETIVRKDVDGLIALYAEDAIFETPAILVTLTDRTQGILRGKKEIKPFFEAGFRKLGNELSRWYRTGLFFSNGRQLTWEYPRETPQGDQDLVCQLAQAWMVRVVAHEPPDHGHRIAAGTPLRLRSTWF